MKWVIFRWLLILGLTAVGLLWNGEIPPTSDELATIAEARRGRPEPPVSYAAVARRYTVGAGSPGIGVRPRAGVGVGAPGVGVMPGVGAGARGVGIAPGNRGGPVNRVGGR